MKTSYSKEQLIKAIKTSFSIRQVLKQLNLKEAGGNYTTIKKLIKEFKLDTSHFTGQGHLKGKTHNWAKTIPLKDILVKNNTYNSHKLKLRLIKNKTFKNECSRCKISIWEEEKLSLHLDHVNGVNDDNRIENLLLFPKNSLHVIYHWYLKLPHKYKKYFNSFINTKSKLINKQI